MRILYYAVFIVLSTVILKASCVCYYMNYNPDTAKVFFRTTCQQYADFMKSVFHEDCELRPFSGYLVLPFKTVDYLFIVGEGCPKGLFLTHSDNTSEGWETQVIYDWEDLAEELDAKVAVIDACYAGYIFDYEIKNVGWLISTSYKENSWNILNNENKNVSSFSEALRCKYENNYNCFVANFISNPCKEANINKCQGWIILKAINRWGWDVYWYDWEYPSMGTCYVNGHPCLWR